MGRFKPPLKGFSQRKYGSATPFSRDLASSSKPVLHAEETAFAQRNHPLKISGKTCKLLVCMRAPLFPCCCSTESTVEILQLNSKGGKQGITVAKWTLTNVVPRHYRCEEITYSLTGTCRFAVTLQKASPLIISSIWKSSCTPAEEFLIR